MPAAAVAAQRQAGSAKSPIHPCGGRQRWHDMPTAKLSQLLVVVTRRAYKKPVIPKRLLVRAALSFARARDCICHNDFWSTRTRRWIHASGTWPARTTHERYVLVGSSSRRAMNWLTWRVVPRVGCSLGLFRAYGCIAAPGGFASAFHAGYVEALLPSLQDKGPLRAEGSGRTTNLGTSPRLINCMEKTDNA